MTIGTVKEVSAEELTEEQTAAYDDIANHQNVLITGAAGTGKSTLLRALRRKYGSRMPIMATTGIAAVNVGGMTIHSWMGLGLAQGTAKQIAKGIRQNKRKAMDNIMGYNRIMIDEISMLDAELMDKIDQVLQILRGNDRPFGSMQLIMFGDFLQLPPVKRGGKAEFAFESLAWMTGEVKTHQLTKIFRQTDDIFARALNDVRIGVISENVSQCLNARYRVIDDDPENEPVNLVTHNIDAERINLDRLEKIDSVEKSYSATDWGKSQAAINLIQKSCLAPTVLKLKVGAQVMLLTNVDTDLGLANGSLGVIKRFSSMGYPLVTFFNGHEAYIEAHEFSVTEGDEKIATREQIPLMLAWAISIHKSQGMTIQKLRVHLAKCFEFGQAYVALSRASSLEGLFIETGDKKKIKAHPAALKFYGY
jgi:ATP-dependent DNA helicase PIF1